MEDEMNKANMDGGMKDGGVNATKNPQRGWHVNYLNILQQKRFLGQTFCRAAHPVAESSEQGACRPFSTS